MEKQRSIVRSEEERDIEAVRAIHVAAFDTSAEADLVDVLRVRASPIVSLVAEDADGAVVGHILFTPVTHAVVPDLMLMGLAPMAVAPDHQRGGVGSALIEAGVERCRELGAAAVIVLGHPEYYPRFGFEPATRFGIDSDYDVPDEVFMAMELESGSLSDKAGRVHYHEAFAGL